MELKSIKTDMKKYKYQLMALPFLPLGKMMQEFEVVERKAAKLVSQFDDKNKQQKAVKDAVLGYLQYVRTEWFSGKHNPEEFNCYRRLDRTNNPCESIHSIMNKGLKNPNATRFSSKLKNLNVLL